MIHCKCSGSTFVITRKEIYTATFRTKQKRKTAAREKTATQEKTDKRLERHGFTALLKQDFD